MAQDIANLSIRDIAKAYRARTLSPVDVVEDCLSRIDRLNPKLNAFVTRCDTSARTAARAAETALRGRDDLPALFGIPFSVKDTLTTAGVRTTFGSRLFSDFIPDEDSAAVAAVRKSGAILIGKTNTPTLGWIPATNNKLFGPGINPWNPALNSGGSSGGAALAAAARLTPVNIGTDGGGSLRVPASFTGTVGYKPSYGRVPNYPTGPNWGLQHIGPIANSIDDIAHALDVLSTPCDGDLYSLPPPERKFADALDRPPSPLRVLFAPDLGYAEAVDPAVVDVCRQAVKAIEQLGHVVSENNPGWPSPMETWRTLFIAGVSARLAPFAKDRAADIEDKLLEFVREGQAMSSDTYYRAWIARNDWWSQVAPTFERFDILVTPTVACPPFSIGQDTAGSIAGKPVSFYGWAPFSAPFNMSGQPAISVPAGFTSSGLPVGLQIVGPRFGDELVLRLAKAYETARPWAHRLPPVLNEN